MWEGGGGRAPEHYTRALRCNAAGPIQICFLRACHSVASDNAIYGEFLTGFLRTTVSCNNSIIIWRFSHGCSQNSIDQVMTMQLSHRLETI